MLVVSEAIGAVGVTPQTWGSLQRLRNEISLKNRKETGKITLFVTILWDVSA
jgi:hypothetical protein